MKNTRGKTSKSQWGLIGGLMLGCSCFSPAIAVDLRTSGKNGILDNPFVAYGVSPVTKTVTGYLVALRTSPGRTDECRFVFTGSLSNGNKLLVKYLSEIDGYDKDGSMSSATVMKKDGGIWMKIKKDQMGGDCDWILPFINEPRVKEDAGYVGISFGNMISGDWSGVFAIKSSRASFYKSPDESSVQDAYLVQGEYIFVYDEQPGWYYVKYERRKKMTVGWIKKSDTVQVNLDKNGGH